jgi:O-antigen ligase
MDSRFPSSLPKLAARRVTLKPTRIDWIIAIFVLIVQLGAFTMVPIMINEDPTHPVLTPSDEDVTIYTKKHIEPEPVDYSLNTNSLIVGLILTSIACIPRIRKALNVVASNKFTFIYIALLFFSAIWSIHPDITIKRSLGYTSLMVAALYISVTFDEDQWIKALYYSIAISSIASIGFVIISPKVGIMQAEGLAGDWRGVFIHKNGFGEAMAIGIFTQLYLLVARVGKKFWRFFWASIFICLAVLAKSGTQLIISSLYLLTFLVYVAWQQHKPFGYAIGCLFAFILVAVGVALAVDPGSTLELIGKDPTLTGRTDIWAVVLQLVEQKPLLGWGYKAMFIDGDSVSYWIWDQLKGFKLTHAHNGWLEVTLELGLVGLCLILVVVGTAIWRGLRCCSTGVLPLGFFSLMFFIGVTLNSFSEAVIGSYQTVGWLVFIMLTFACGQRLSQNQGKRLVRSPPMKMRSRHALGSGPNNSRDHCR